MELRGHLNLLLLGTLAAVDPAHGYAVIAALRERTGNAFDLPEGTVYPALHRLERDGLVTSDWSTEASGRRRVYRLTRAGLAMLEVKSVQWRVFATGCRGSCNGPDDRRLPRRTVRPARRHRRGRPALSGGG
jgi:DNA-binding PadR family transcriptional regulator